MARLFFLLCAGLLFSLTTLAHAADEAAPEADTPELDIILQSNLETTKEHSAKYRQDLRDGARKAFRSLAPKVYSEEDKPADGAARFRVILEHKGRVWIGPRPEVTRSNVTPEADRVAWRLPVRHEGVVTLRLLKWEGGQYRPLGAPTFAFPARPNNRDNPEQWVEVATLAVPPNLPPPPQMPLSMQEAQAKVLERVEARDLEAPLLNALIQTRLLRAGFINPMSAGAQVALTNNSPWALNGVDLYVEWPQGPEAFGLAFRHEFPTPLPPGRSAPAGGTERPTRTSLSTANPASVVGATFSRALPEPQPPEKNTGRKPSRRTERRR